MLTTLLNNILCATNISKSSYTLQPYFNAIVTRVSPFRSGASANVTNDRWRLSSDDLLHCLTSSTFSRHSSSLETSFPKTYVRDSLHFDVKLLSCCDEWAWSPSDSLFWGIRVVRTRRPVDGWHIVSSMNVKIMWLHIMCSFNSLQLLTITTILL